MGFEKQVKDGHCEFSRYISEAQWSTSVWHQLDEIQKLKPDRVLEIGPGPGPGVFKAVAAAFGIAVETLNLLGRWQRAQTGVARIKTNRTWPRGLRQFGNRRYPIYASC